MHHRGKVAAVLAAAAVMCGTDAASAATTAYVTAAGKNITALVPIDTETRIAGAPITVGGSPYGVVPSSDGSTLYVMGAGKVTKVDVATGTTTNWAVGGASDPLRDAVLSKDGKTLWVTNAAGSG